MKNKYKKISLRLFMAVALALVGCGGGGGGTLPGGGIPGGGTNGGGSTPLPVTLTSISITPANPAALPAGLTQQFTATGIYSDGTSAPLTSATWYITNSTKASISVSGLATGVAAGVTYVSASAGGAISSYVPLYVTQAVVTSMAITPANAVVGIGQPVQFIATAQYSDGTSGDATTSASWSANSTLVATMNSTANVFTSTPGVAAGASPGNTAITAVLSPMSINPVSAVAAVTVTNSYAVGGSLSGLPASGVSVTVADNGTDTLTMTNNTVTPTSQQPFVFNTTLLAGSAYNLTVTAQPTAPAHPCTVVNGNGVISAAAPAPVTWAQIVCAPAVGTVAGYFVNGSYDVYGGYVNTATSSAAKFNGPMGVALDPNIPGNMYVTDATNNVIRLVSASGAVSTFAGTAPTVAGTPAPLGYVNSGGAASPQFRTPTGIAVDKVSGNVYVADRLNNIIRMITPAGVVSTLAGAAPTAGGGAATPGYTAGTTTLAAAQFNAPWAVAVDGNGTIYVADTGNFVIRKIVPTGPSAGVSTLAGMGTPLGQGYLNATGTAAKFNSVVALAVDPTNTYLYVADVCVVRQIEIATGIVTTLAGPSTVYQGGYTDGPVATALFSGISGLASDSLGKLYVSENGNGLRVITPGGVPASLSTGTVSTVTSPTYVGFRDGPAASAGIASAYGLAVDASNTVFIADGSYNLIRKYTP